MVKFYYKTRSTALDMILSCHVNVVETARLNNDIIIIIIWLESKPIRKCVIAVLLNIFWIRCFMLYFVFY